MSARKGIKKYKEEAEIKLLAEFKQLLEYKAFHGVDASLLTAEQKQKAGNMINLIEEKMNRGHTPENPVLKGRSCFNGRVQRRRPEVKLFCQLDPSFEKFVVKENGQKVLYVQLDKALYGCVQSVLLWYELYFTTLKDMVLRSILTICVLPTL
jgi:hypothetical protein